MLALGITCSVLTAGLGLLFVIVYYLSENKLYKILLFVATIVCALPSCVGYCLSSVGGNIAGGGVFCAFSMAVLFGMAALDNDFEGYIYILSLSAVLFILSLACFLNIGYFLGLGIVCTVIVIAYIIVTGIIFNTGTHNSAIVNCVKIVSVILAALSAVGIVVGYTVYDTRKDPVTADIKCNIYKYNLVTQTVGSEVDNNKLNIEDYYAVQFNFEFKNLLGLGASKQNLQSNMEFSTNVVNYISEGKAFTKSNTSGTLWTYKFTVDSKSEKSFNSGYFILKYDSESLSNPIKKITAKLYSLSEELPTQQLITSLTFDHKLIKTAYSFSETNIIKDLGAGEDYCYRISVPENCKKFFITVYDDTKSAVYCSTVENVEGSYFYFKLVDYLAKNMTEAGYTEMLKQTRSLIVTIVAEESDYNVETSLDYKITLQKK